MKLINGLDSSRRVSPRHPNYSYWSLAHSTVPGGGTIANSDESKSTSMDDHEASLSIFKIS